MYEKLKNNSFVAYLCFWGLTFIFLYVFSPGTSPSNPFLGIDTSIFIVIGKSLSEGMLPYRDCFDHKGPLLFYIYSIIQYGLIGKLGLFLLQTTSVSVSIYFAWKLLRLFLGLKVSLISLFFLLCCFVATVESGGQCEEWSLPVSMVLLYAVIKRLKSDESAEYVSTWLAFFLGLGMAWQFAIRITNAGIVSGLILGGGIIILHSRDWKRLFIYLLAITSGFLLFIAPIILHYYLCDALYEVWYGTIGYNFNYSNSGACDLCKVLIWTLPVAFVIIGGYWIRGSFFSTRLWFIMLIVNVSTIISLIPGNSYGHYFINYIPVICCALIVTGLLIKKYHANRYFFYLFSIGMIFPYYGPAMSMATHGLICCFFPGHPIPSFNKYVAAKRFSKTIQSSGFNRVLLLDASPQGYCYMNMIPCHKYFVLQSWLSRADEQIGKEVRAFLESKNAPDWIILEGKPLSDVSQKPETELISDVVWENYTFVDQGIARDEKKENTYILFRRNDISLRKELPAQTMGGSCRGL